MVTSGTTGAGGVVGLDGSSQMVVVSSTVTQAVSISV